MSKYTINGDESQIIEAKDEQEATRLFVQENLSPLSEEEQEKRYNELLDCEGPQQIHGVGVYDTAYLLKHLDPTAYACGLSDWLADSDDIVYMYGEYYDKTEFDDIADGVELLTL